MSGLREDDVRARSNRPARVLRRVAVVREHADVGLGRLVHVADELVQLGELVLRERLGRKQIQGAARRVRQDRVQRGRVVAQRLARRGRRRHDEVAAGERELEGRGLVRVELCDAARFERRAQTGIDERGPLGVLRVRGGQRPNRRDPGVGIVGPAGADGAESLEGAREGLLARGRRWAFARPSAAPARPGQPAAAQAVRVPAPAQPWAGMVTRRGGERRRPITGF